MRASDKLCLGLIPDDTFNHGLDWGFAALNPALNVESSERVEGREIARKTTELGRVEEHDSRALADVQIAAAIPATHGPVRERRGRPRARGAAAPGAGRPACRAARDSHRGRGRRRSRRRDDRVPIAHPIAERLAAAVRERQRLRSAGISAEAAARGLVALDTLGFPESALALEQELRDHQQRNAGWLSRFDLALQLD
jgi:hypothetical protein